MEIRSLHMQPDSLQTPPSPCSVCDKEFQPADDLEFVCKDCRKLLSGHCDCGFDDVVMDWGIETEGDFPYYWIIECVCGNEMKSPLHSLGRQDEEAKSLHARWCAKESA